MQKRKEPCAGEFYRHFKNRLYQIICLAEREEDGTRVVVYQAMYGDFRIFTRPLESFMSEIDHVKYPDAAGIFRFEKVARKNGGFVSAETGAAVSSDNAESAAIPAEKKERPHLKPTFSMPGLQLFGGDPPADAVAAAAESAAAPVSPVNGLIVSGAPSEPSLPAVNTARTSRALMDLLDADDLNQKLAILKSRRNEFTSADMDSLATVYGFSGRGGSISEQIDSLVGFLNLQKKYEGDRLRKDSTCSILKRN